MNDCSAENALQDLLKLTLTKLRYYESFWGVGKTIYRPRFDTMLSLYRDPKKSFVDIGRAVGMTTENARLLYNNYFAELCPELDIAQKRQRLRIELRRKTQKDRWVDDLDMLKEARTRGLRIDLEQIRAGNCVYKKGNVFINDKGCLVIIIRTSWDTCGYGIYYSYTYLGVTTIKKHEFVLITQLLDGDEKRFFIIPSKDILDKKKVNGHGVVTIAIPKVKLCRRKRGPKPSLDVFEYQDAWHLLK